MQWLLVVSLWYNGQQQVVEAETYSTQNECLYRKDSFSSTAYERNVLIRDIKCIEIPSKVKLTVSIEPEKI